jgi:hypothetical protein
MQADKSIDQFDRDLPGTEMAPRQPQQEVFGDSEVISDGAAKVASLLQIAGEVLQDYAEMAGGDTVPDVGTEQSDAFHTKPGTIRFSRLRHLSFNPLRRKEKS